MIKPESSENNWISLFDGKSLKGWHSYGEASAGKAWKVADGTLYLDAERIEEGKVVGGGDLVSEEEFENFHLMLEWKLDTGGNSGILFHVQEDPERYEASWQSGPEMQLLDNQGHPDGHLDKRRSGDLYDLIAASKDTNKPIGEWNQTQISCQDSQLEIKLNGQTILTTQLWNEHWRELISHSKFKDIAGFGTYRKGRIALQDHGHPVWFRNIRIRRL